MYDINGYDTRSAQSMEPYLPRFSKEIHERNLLYKSIFPWNQNWMITTQKAHSTVANDVPSVNYISVIYIVDLLNSGKK